MTTPLSIPDQMLDFFLDNPNVFWWRGAKETLPPFGDVTAVAGITGEIQAWRYDDGSAVGGPYAMTNASASDWYGTFPIVAGLEEGDVLDIRLQLLSGANVIAQKDVQARAKRNT